MKKKLALVLLCVLIAVVSLMGCNACDDTPKPDENIASKVFKVDSIGRHIPGTGLYPWSATVYDDDGEEFTTPSIDILKSNTMDSNNWAGWSFEFKTSSLRVTRISFEVVTESDCTFNLMFARGTETYGVIKKNVLANTATLFDFSGLDLTKSNTNKGRLGFFNEKPDNMTYDEYEELGGYTTKWKMINLKVYGEEI